jgi:hypothetical protein
VPRGWLKSWNANRKTSTAIAVGSSPLYPRLQINEARIQPLAILNLQEVVFNHPITKLPIYPILPGFALFKPV